MRLCLVFEILTMNASKDDAMEQVLAAAGKYTEKYRYKCPAIVSDIGTIK